MDSGLPGLEYAEERGELDHHDQQVRRGLVKTVTHKLAYMRQCDEESWGRKGVLSCLLGTSHAYLARARGS
jgi:hypothetical protein